MTHSGVAESRRPARSVSDLAGLLCYHEGLLRDRIRNRAFARALAHRVAPGADVLDIGSGSGIWAVLAARRGARRVVAVEREELLVPVIERMALDNGVSDRVRVVRASAADLDFGPEFDVVISETVGGVAFDEDIVPILAMARARFLRPGGTLIPEGLSLRAAPVAWRVRPQARPLVTTAFDELLSQVARPVEGARLELRARPATLVAVRLGETQETPDLSSRTASWPVRDGATVDGLAVWTHVALTDRVSLDTRVDTNWQPTFCPLDPLGRGPGRLDVRIDLRLCFSWEASFTPAKGAPSRVVHDPRLAYASVRPRGR